MKSIALCVLALCLLAASGDAAPSTPNAPAIKQLGHMPLYFTKNVGQWPDSILFRASAGGTVMWFTNDGIWYQFTKHIKKNSTGEEALAAGLGPRRPDRPGKFGHEQDSLETALVKAQFVGANPQAAVVGLEEQAYRCNYFLGNDPAKWHADVPNYSAVSMRGIYPGVDATFRGDSGLLCYELKGDADAIAKVKTAYLGAPASKQTDGPVILKTSLGDKQFKGPLLVADAREATTTISPTSANNVTLTYSTYLGGSSDDAGRSVAVDASGCAYVTGSTYSADYPTQSAYQTDPGDSRWDAFVTKLSASGNSLVYSTYLGGNNEDLSYGIAVDGEGSAYVTGSTQSTNFPTQSPYQATHGGWVLDVFVTKLSPSGSSLVYSTYLGGNGYDQGWGIAVDGLGNAYVTGGTSSSNFPTQSPYQTNPDAGYEDVFVTKLSPAGNSLVYSTYLGGSAGDIGSGIAVDGAGNAYVVGATSSTDFPTQAPYQATHGGGYDDAFVTKLSAAGNSLVYSTYLGGGRDEWSYGIAVDGQGSAYVTGYTFSTNFPTEAPYQTYQGPADSTDAFVTKLSASGSSLVYSTYLGGHSSERSNGIAVDGQGCAYVTGWTTGTDFPTQAPYQATHGGGYRDAFVTKLSAAGNSLVYSTYLGGSNFDEGWGIAVDGAGAAYVTGYTYSSNFPTQNPYQVSLAGGAGSDMFVTKLGLPVDSDGDGIADAVDNCPLVANANQLNTDGDALGDVCDPDDDNDGVLDGADNCPSVANPLQEDNDQNGIGNACCCLGLRGNVNMLSIVDVSDLSLLVAYLTQSPAPTLPCPEAGNVNGLSIVDVSDLSLLVAYLTGNPAPTLPNCP